MQAITQTLFSKIPQKSPLATICECSHDDLAYIEKTKRETAEIWREIRAKREKRARDKAASNQFWGDFFGAIGQATREYAEQNQGSYAGVGNGSGRNKSSIPILVSVKKYADHRCTVAEKWRFSGLNRSLKKVPIISNVMTKTKTGQEGGAEQEFKNACWISTAWLTNRSNNEAVGVTSLRGIRAPFRKKKWP